MRLEKSAQNGLCPACEGLCEALAERWHPGALGRLWAVWGLCGRRLVKEFCEDISRRKPTWEAVPEQQFCGSNPAVSASRKKYKIKGGGRLRPPPAHKAPQCGAFRDFGTDVGFRDFGLSARWWDCEVLQSQAVPAFFTDAAN